MVAGCPRSGSTIIGKILSMSPRTGYLEEPLNPQTGLEGTSHFFVFPEADPGHQELYDTIVERIRTGKAKYKESFYKPADPGFARSVFYKLFTNKYHFTYRIGTLNPLAHTYISKDPTATLASEYLHQKHGYHVLLTLRHPCGVIASHQRLGWKSALAAVLHNNQVIEHLSEDFKALKIEALSEVEALAWYWRAINEMIEAFLRRNPAMKFIEHEAFSRDPVGTSRAMYDWAGLSFSPYIERKVRSMTSSRNTTAPRADRAHTLKRNSKDNIERWRNLLNEDEIQTIMGITGHTYERIKNLPNRLSPSVT